MLLSRKEKWFSSYDANLNPYILSINLLLLLSKKRTRGLIYDRMELIKLLDDRTSFEAINSLNTAIVLLQSRNLISFSNNNDLRSRIHINDNGMKLIEKYNISKKNVH